MSDEGTSYRKTGYRKKRYKKIGFYICAAVLILAIALFFYTYKKSVVKILTPFFLSIPLAYVVKPIADKLAVKKIPAGLSILMVYIIFIAVVTGVAIFFIPELTDNIRELMETLPSLMSDYERIFNRLLSAIKSSKWSDEVKAVIFKGIEDGANVIQRSLVGFLENGLNVIVDMVKMIVNLAIGMVITFYVVKDADKFRDFSLSLFPRRWRAGIAGIGKDINLILKGFIQGQMLVSLLVGAIETAGLILVGVKYPLALGMIGGLTNIIPYFGPYIGAVPAFAVALTISPIKGLWTILVFVAAQQIDNSFISPKMIEGKLGLHPVATIFAVLVGGEFYGIIGMLLAVPIMAIMRVLINKAVEAIA